MVHLPYRDCARVITWPQFCGSCGPSGKGFQAWWWRLGVGNSGVELYGPGLEDLKKWRKAWVGGGVGFQGGGPKARKEMWSCTVLYHTIL